MSVKIQIHSLRKLYSMYEEVLEHFPDKTDVDSSFCHNRCDISHYRHRIVQVSRSSNKNNIAVNLFRFCDMKTQQRYILKEERSISRKENVVLLYTSHDFLKSHEQASKSTQIPLPKLKLAPLC